MSFKLLSNLGNGYMGLTIQFSKLFEIFYNKSLKRKWYMKKQRKRVTLRKKEKENMAIKKIFNDNFKRDFL